MELFGIAKGKEATDRVVELMDQVALGSGMLRYQASRLSGGERQRVAIARALAAEPDVMICDEITSALDVSVQGSIVALLEGLRQERGISMLFVTHNLALVRSIAARVEILQEGRVVEAGLGGDGHGHPAGGVHPQAAVATAPGSTEVGARPPPRGPGSRDSRFTDPQDEPAWRHVVVPADAGRDAADGAARRSRCEIAGAGRTRGPRRSGSRRRWSTSLLVLDGGTRRPRVVRRRARPGHAVPRRVDDEVGARPPGRPRRPRRRPGAGRPGDRARAGAARHRVRRHHGARRPDHDHRRRLGRGPP